MKQLRRDLGFLAIVALVCLGVGLALNAVRAKPLPLWSIAPDLLLAGSLGEALIAPGEVEFVDFETVERALADPDIQIVDARDDAFYQIGHLPGAVNVSRGDFAAGYKSLRGKENVRLIVYCEGASCEDSLVVAWALARLGYRPVVYQGGWEEWSQLNGPVAR